MSEPDIHQNSPGDTSPSPTAASTSQALRIGNVLMAVVPLAIVALGVFAFVVFGGADWLSSLTNPPLVPASGQVVFDGKPLAGAQITTQHENEKLTGAIGVTDEQGRFTLQTDIDGYVDGAYAGEHRVVVTAYLTNNSASAPPLLTPQQYSSYATTPLRIVVSADEQNEPVFTLEGESPASRAADGDSSDRRGGRVRGAGFASETIIARLR